MDLDVSGRAFYVTGGSSGIGHACVRLLLAEQAIVATCARDDSRLRHAWMHLDPEQRERLRLYQCDVRDEVAMGGSVEAFVADTGRLDGVVPNAGVGASGAALATSNDEWLAEMRVKLSGALNLVRAALPSLVESDAPRVVIVNGITGRRPEPSMAAVSAARAALLSLTHSLASELAPASVCVNAVNVGVIDTARQRDRHVRSASSLEYRDWTREEARRRGVLFGRMGRPEEVAAVIAFLLSQHASYITGAAVDVAGGAGVIASGATA